MKRNMLSDFSRCVCGTWLITVRPFSTEGKNRNVKQMCLQAEQTTWPGRLLAPFSIKEPMPWFSCSQIGFDGQPPRGLFTESASLLLLAAFAGGFVQSLWFYLVSVVLFAEGGLACEFCGTVWPDERSLTQHLCNCRSVHVFSVT